MVNATRQVARDQRDSSAVTESEQDAIRSLGSLEHLFWLLDHHHFVHFAVTALISGETSPRDWRRALDRLQKRHPILSVCIDGEPDSVPLFRQADVTRFRCGLWRMSLSCAGKSKLERNWRGLSIQVEHRSFAPF